MGVVFSKVHGILDTISIFCYYDFSTKYLPGSGEIASSCSVVPEATFVSVDLIDFICCKADLIMWNWREIIIREFYRSINSNTLKQSEGWPQEPQNAIRSNQIPTAEVFVWIENEEIKLMLFSYLIELKRSSLYCDKKLFQKRSWTQFPMRFRKSKVTMYKSNEAQARHTIQGNCKVISLCT